MTQSLWVNAPSVKAVYGEQIRQIIVAEEGKGLAGIDMPSAHPRILADFTQNQKFIDAVDGKEEDEDGNYVGEDFHTVNSILFQLNTEDEVAEARKTQDKELIKKLSKQRGTGKGGSYTCLYGGSDNKLAMTMKLPIKLGGELKRNFLSGLGLDVLLEEVEETWDKYKRIVQQESGGKTLRMSGSYIPVLGGYWVFCKSKHTIINYKALGSEAVVQKVAVNLFERELRERGLDKDNGVVINYHDEILVEYDKKDKEEVVSLMAKMYNEAAKSLGLTLDWSSTVKTGDNYAVCH